MGQSVLGEKELAIREQNFEKAGQLLEYEMDIRVQVQVLKQALQINEKTSLKRVQIDMVMEEVLHKRLIGQNHAIVSVSKAIRRARVGLRNPNRPIASFIFAGPTGVGKTELTKSLASYMFGT